jgi:Glycosyl transferases group 1
MSGRKPLVHCTMWGVPGVRLVDRRVLGRLGVVKDLLCATRPGDAVLLCGSLGASDWYIDQIASVALRWIRRRVTIVIADATWHARSTPGEARHPAVARVIELWTRTLFRLAKAPQTHFCFLSRQECDDAIRQAGISPANVHFTPFSSTIWGAERRSELDALSRRPGGHVFSGGNASRDYALLLAAAEGLGASFVVATTRELHPLPANVTARGVSPDEFLELMATSKAVVLPLATTTGRSGGQQTYLNAMSLGKPVVVTDAPGVRDYLTDGFDALIVQPTPEAVRDAIVWLLDPRHAGQVAVMTARARLTAEAHRPERYYEHLVTLARDLAEKGYKRRDKPFPFRTSWSN